MIKVLPGESYTEKAGANRGVVRVSILPDNSFAILDDRKVVIEPNVVVFWHSDSAGTFHGIKSPEILKTTSSDTAPELTEADYRGAICRSSSGGRSIAAGILKIDRPLALITSGYLGRRNWQIHLLSPTTDGGYEWKTFDPPSYRAMYATPETL